MQEPPPTIDAQCARLRAGTASGGNRSGQESYKAVAECTDQTVQYWLDYVSEKGRVPVFPADVNECIKDKLEGYHQ